MSGIKAGDLVMVVRVSPCCGNASAVGKVFTVVEIKNGQSRCRFCFERFRDAHTNGSGVNVLLSRLIRIDPPALPESIQDEREVTA